MFLNVREFLSRLCRKQKQRVTEFREKLEAHALVFRFAAQDAEAEPVPAAEPAGTAVWLHPGYVHFGSWNFAAVHLRQIATDMPEREARGLRWLRIDSSDEDPAAARVQTCIDHFKALLAFDQAWCLSLWVISEEESDWPADETSSTVPVRACAVEPCVIWRGSSEEDRRRKQTARKRMVPQPKAGSKKPRATMGALQDDFAAALELLDSSEADPAARGSALDSDDEERFGELAPFDSPAGSASDAESAGPDEGDQEKHESGGSDSQETSEAADLPNFQELFASDDEVGSLAAGVYVLQNPSVPQVLESGSSKTVVEPKYVALGCDAWYVLSMTFNRNAGLQGWICFFFFLRGFQQESTISASLDVVGRT